MDGNLKKKCFDELKKHTAESQFGANEVAKEYFLLKAAKAEKNRRRMIIWLQWQIYVSERKCVKEKLKFEAYKK
jgi:hypothetical protein